MRVVERDELERTIKTYASQRTGALHQRPELSIETLDHFEVGVIEDPLPGDEWLRRGITIPFRLWSPSGLGHAMMKVRMPDNAKVGGKYQIGLVDAWLHNHNHGIVPFYADPLLNAGTVVITEGEFDAMVVHQLEGNIAAMGIPGIETWTREKRYWCYMLRGKQVVIAYDADEAGRRGAAKVGAMLKEFDCTIQQVALPEGTDISDIARTAGLGGVRKALSL